MRISPNHPLRRFLADLVWRRFREGAGIRDPRVSDYVAGVLTDFVHVDNLYGIRNAAGRRLEEVAEMLVESNPLLDAPTFEREREVRKHIGDFTLFFAGLFPESLSSRMLRRRMRLDAFVDYVRTGKESYAIVSAFDYFPYREEAPLFRRLSQDFELCVYGLNLVKQDLERFQQDYYRRWKATWSGAS
jgi:hypothetical protein